MVNIFFLNDFRRDVFSFFLMIPVVTWSSEPHRVRLCHKIQLPLNRWNLVLTRYDLHVHAHHHQHVLHLVLQFPLHFKSVVLSAVFVK